MGDAPLRNGFLACADPDRLQTICDQLGSADVQAFFDRWSHHLPWPLTGVDRGAGYEYRLAISQLEASLAQVFKRPVQGRHPPLHGHHVRAERALLYSRPYLRILPPKWQALLPADDTLRRPLGATLNPLDTEIRTRREGANLAA